MLKFKILSVFVISISALLSGCNKKDDITMWNELASLLHDQVMNTENSSDKLGFEIQTNKKKYQEDFIGCIRNIFNKKLTSEERDAIDIKYSNISEGLDKPASQYKLSVRDAFDEYDNYKKFDHYTDVCLFGALHGDDDLRVLYMRSIFF